MPRLHLLEAASPRPLAEVPAPATARGARLCRSERERLARRLSIAMTLARWSNGMLARALEISPSYAREIRIGERPLGDERLAVLLRFDRLAAELRAVGLAPAEAA